MKTQEIIDVVSAVLASQETSPTATALKDAVATELSQHPAYRQNWAQFEAQPQVQKPILVGILQVVLQNKPALAQKLNALLAQHQQGQNASAPQQHIEGGAFFGKVEVGGDLAGRDMKKTITYHNPDPEAIARAFSKIYVEVAQQPDLAPQDKADVREDLQEVEEELKKGEEARESFIRRRLLSVQQMAPDILDVVLTTFANPVLGVGMVAKKVADKMRAEAGSEPEAA